MRQVEGKIATDLGGELAQWNPSVQLSAISFNEVHLGRGFLRSRIERLFPTFHVHWLPLLHLLSANIEIARVYALLDFPENVARIVPFEIRDEVSILGCEEHTVIALAEAVAPGSRAIGQHVVFEYLVRRLLTSLNKSWTGEKGVNAFYISPEKASQVEVVGVIALVLRIGGEEHHLWFGMGPNSTEIIDTSWRVISEGDTGSGKDRFPQQGEYEITFDLAEVIVSPDRLIDYLRDGSLIDLEIPFSTQVVVKANGKPCGYGDLCQFEKCFAVRMISSEVPSWQVPPEGLTQVCARVAHTVMSSEQLRDSCRQGGVMLSDTAISNRLSLVIRGEEVSHARVGQLGGHLALFVDSG